MFGKSIKSYNKSNGIRLSRRGIDAYHKPSESGQTYTSKGTAIHYSETTEKKPEIYGSEQIKERYINGKDVIDLSAGNSFARTRLEVPYAHRFVGADPFNMPYESNVYALSDVYDTAILSNTLNVIDNDRAIIRLLQIARTVADTTLITVYENKTEYKNHGGKGTSTKGETCYQRYCPLDDYVGLAERVFGVGNVRIERFAKIGKNNNKTYFDVMICSAGRS